MKLITINTDPSRRDLHLFGAAWLVCGLAVLGVLIWKGASGGVVAGWGAFCVGGPLLGWTWSPFMRWAYIVLAVAAYPIGFVVSHVILAIIYYLVITPTGLLLRLCKRGFFPKRPDATMESYWIPKPGRRDARRYFKQY